MVASARTGSGAMSSPSRTPFVSVATSSTSRSSKTSTRRRRSTGSTCAALSTMPCRCSSSRTWSGQGWTRPGGRTTSQGGPIRSGGGRCGWVTTRAALVITPPWWWSPRLPLPASGSGCWKSTTGAGSTSSTRRRRSSASPRSSESLIWGSTSLASAPGSMTCSSLCSKGCATPSTTASRASRGWCSR
ncbi:hypothetical protein D3C85_1263130 [compost metagenome]